MSVFRSIFGRLLHTRSQKAEQQNPKKKPEKNLPADLNSAVEKIRSLLGQSDDFIVRRFTVEGNEPVDAALLYIDGMLETSEVELNALRPLLQPESESLRQLLNRRSIYRIAKETLLTVSQVEEVSDSDGLAMGMLLGQAVLLFDGTAGGLVISVKSASLRSVEPPEAQSIIRGPRDGFTENIRINTVLVRRRLRDPNLTLEWMRLGRRSRTDVVVGYIAGLANPEIVKEVKRRLEGIDIDAILESGHIEQMIEENWWTVFPTVQESERPDQIAAGLLDGRVAVLVDNTPFALLVPATIPMFLASPEDMYFRWPIASLVRILRYFSAAVSLTAPSLYVALTSYHPGMIPTNLALSIGASREGVPFPAFAEALLMEVVMETLREAGIRLPTPIGQTIGIVGAIIIGEAAVQAGLVSPIMVVTVAITAISNFVIPTYSFAISLRILRFGLLILASAAGLFGLMIGLLLIISHLSILESFGVPYTAPFAPISRFGDWRDALLRGPWLGMHRRPEYLEPEDEQRLGEDGKDTG